MGRSGSCLVSALVFVLLEVCAVRCDITDGTAEHLKREHSLMKPFQGVGSSPSSQWDFSGSTLVTSSYVRLTPDERSKQGSIWNTVPCHLKDWEMHVQFKVHGSGKKNLHGDGIAIWYTKDRLHPGPVFGNKDQFLGLAIFLDTFRNDLHGMDGLCFPTMLSTTINNDCWGACGTQTEDDRRRQAKDRRSGPTGPGPQNHSEELLRSGNVLPAVSSFFPVRRGWTEFKAPTNSKLTMPQRFRTLRFHTPRHR